MHDVVCLSSEEHHLASVDTIRTMVLTEHFLPQKGGSINWLLNTYGRYKSGEVVFVASCCQGDRLTDQNLSFNVERIPMMMTDWDPFIPSSLLRYLRIVWEVNKCCHAYSVEQIHCAKVLPEGLVAWVMRPFKNIPYLIYAHGEEILTALTSRKLSWLLPRIYRGAEAIIANSRNTKSLLQGIGVDPGKICIIHPGVDRQSFRAREDEIESIRQKHHLGKSPLLLTVGRMQRRKGQDMVIRALPHIKQRVTNVKYILVGNGEELAALQTLAQTLGVTESVVFAGSVPDQDLAAYYAVCDVFVMPNRQIEGDIEGFGMVYLEAGAAGKPVVGGQSGGTEDAILEGITGLRVDGNNVEAITNAVVSLLIQPEKARAMGEAGQRRVEEEFTWEAVVGRTRQLSAAIQQGILPTQRAYKG